MKDTNKIKNQLKIRRVARVRSKIFGSFSRPRLAVFRSLKHLSVQAIDDTASKTIACVYDREVKEKDNKSTAKKMGLLLAEKLLALKVDRAIFDKRHYKYHGLIKELADGVRAGGIKM